MVGMTQSGPSDGCPRCGTRVDGSSFDRAVGETEVRMSRRTTLDVPSFGEVVMIALGAQRVARAVSTDEITAPVRARLERWAESTRGTRYGAPARGAAKLVQCPVC